MSERPTIERAGAVQPRRRRSAPRARTSPRVAVVTAAAGSAPAAVLVLGAAYVAINLHRRATRPATTSRCTCARPRACSRATSARSSPTTASCGTHTAVTPQIYPWGFPLLLAPFVRVFGIDYDRLKLVEVACCACGSCCSTASCGAGRAHRRPRPHRRVRHGDLYLLHTDQLLTEFPHMMAVAVVIWWLDRVMPRPPHRRRRRAISSCSACCCGRLQRAAREHAVPRHRRRPARRRARRAQPRHRARTGRRGRNRGAAVEDAARSRTSRSRSAP